MIFYYIVETGWYWTPRRFTLKRSTHDWRDLAREVRETSWSWEGICSPWFWMWSQTRALCSQQTARQLVLNFEYLIQFWHRFLLQIVIIFCHWDHWHCGVNPFFLFHCRIYLFIYFFMIEFGPQGKRRACDLSFMRYGPRLNYVIPWENSCLFFIEVARFLSNSLSIKLLQ